jgi:hypothetical protein
MKKKSISILAGAGLPAALVLTQIILGGCASPREPKSAGAANEPAPKTASGKGGAELWAVNCAHCHNIRSPNFYSDAQWDVAMMHMRVRANLTAEESRKILAFLKSAD